MPIKILGIHHHAVRIDDVQQPFEAVRHFYVDVLGLRADEGRGTIPGVPGWWMDVGDNAQIHLIGGDYPSRFAKGPGQDPTAPHVALAVENIAEAKAELERLGVAYWTLVGVAGPETEQVFVNDPCGNMIELHQFDKCRCAAANRKG